MSRNRSGKMPSYIDLYAAHLPVLGKAGQGRLKQARVHVLGCGGLGSQIVLNLAAAGVRSLSVNDPQTLEPENANRFPMISLADLGKPKVDLLRELLGKRPYLDFSGIVAANEDESVDCYCQAADFLICCSNTVSSRIAAAHKAIQLSKPLIDVSVADGRQALAGFIKLWRPEMANWAACPACYLPTKVDVSRGEGLLSSVVTVAAAIASHLALEMMFHRVISLSTANLFWIDLRSYRLEFLSVQKNLSCLACKS